MNSRDGCLSGILKLLLLTWLFDWLQERFGWGKGCSCTGCGCGCLLFVVFVAMACMIVLSTNWFQFGF